MMMITVEKVAVKVGSRHGAVHLQILRNPPPQPRHRHDDLEGRPRRQLILDRLVHQRVIRIGNQLIPSDRPMRNCGECIRVVARMRHQRQNLTRPRVHRHHCPVGVAQRLLRRPLNVDIDGSCFRSCPESRQLDTPGDNLAPVAVHDFIH